MRFFTTTTFPFRNTYQLPSANCTETLTTDFWTFSWVREGLFILYYLFPLSICLMCFTREKVGFAQHAAVILVIGVWGFIMFVYDIQELVYANVGPSDPNYTPINLARDPQWCLYYGGQPGTEYVCTYVNTCSGPAINPNNFTIFWPFMYRVIANIILVMLIIVDIGYMRIWYKLITPPTTTTPVAFKIGNYERYDIKKR